MTFFPALFVSLNLMCYCYRRKLLSVCFILLFCDWEQCVTRVGGGDVGEFLFRPRTRRCSVLEFPLYLSSCNDNKGFQPVYLHKLHRLTMLHKPDWVKLTQRWWKFLHVPEVLTNLFSICVGKLLIFFFFNRNLCEISPDARRVPV